MAKELNNKFNQERNDYEGKLKGLRQKNIESENKALVMANDIDRLNRALNEKNKEIDALKDQLAEAEQEKDRALQELKQEIALQNKAAYDAELSDILRKTEKEKQMLDAKNRELKRNILELENKMAYESVEIEKMKALYEGIKKEAEDWKERCKELEEEKKQAGRLRRSKQVFSRQVKAGKEE